MPPSSSVTPVKNTLLCFVHYDETTYAYIKMYHTSVFGNLNFRPVRVEAVNKLDLNKLKASW